jgi:hypothetical protein
MHVTVPRELLVVKPEVSSFSALASFSQLLFFTLQRMTTSLSRHINLRPTVKKNLLFSTSAICPNQMVCFSILFLFSETKFSHLTA